MNKLGLASIALLGLAFTACSNDNEGNGNPSETVRPLVISTQQIGYEGSGLEVEGENTLTDMKACVFENGIMTKTFEDLQPTSEGYDLQMDSYNGTIYMIANAEGMLDLKQMQNEGISEQEWKETVLEMKNSRTSNIFTGSLVLDGQSRSPQSLTLKRGVARFDLNINVTGTASIESLTLKNAAQSAYLLPQDEGVKSPANIVRKDMSVTFETPLTASTPAVLYVYEQENDGLEISIEAVIDGRHKTLTKTLEGNLKRNTVYTVTVRKDDIDVVVKVGLEDWEMGNDTEIIPQL